MSKPEWRSLTLNGKTTYHHPRNPRTMAEFQDGQWVLLIGKRPVSTHPNLTLLRQAAEVEINRLPY